ncbi:NADH-quinone oxidoreductase subunit L [Bacillaceae bacterium]
MMENAWLIPFFPLLAFILLTAFGRRMREGAAYVGILATVISFVLAALAFAERFTEKTDAKIVDFEWLAIGDNVIRLGYEVTNLNALMLVVVTLVSMLVHIYSRGYMEGDERISVFYQYLALFTFSMLGLVLSPNLLQLYIFWELVGVCSFLLVGFYYYKPEAKAAAKKAFLMTRIGDVGLFIAIALIFWQVGSFDYTAIFNAVETGELAGGTLALIAILIFFGAVGKSGQFPLHTWLPDAMEGPTPVSALIHAATMVAAGVYLVARLFELFAASPLALDVVAYIGAFTAIFAASIGLTQTDIKRVLAYSTVSQLGYMMLALGAAGIAGYAAGAFHLYTHAFFKALLFLAAGSVIHAVHTQDIFRMGGLWRTMKWTGTGFLVGALALAGIPPFSGFFSKEEILISVYASGRTGLFWVAVLTGFLTAFYIFRLFFLTFAGESRSQEKRVHESPPVMTLPIVILAVLAAIAGFVHTPWSPVLGEWLVQDVNGAGELAHAGGSGWISFVAVGLALLGVVLAWLMYGKGSVRPQTLASALPFLYRLSYRKYYVDEIYQAVFVTPLRGLGTLLNALDLYLLDGIVRLVGGIPGWLGNLAARVQNGQIQTYGAVAVLGLVLLLAGLTAARGYFG